MGERESLRAPETPVWLTGDFPAALAPNPRNAADASGGFGMIGADGEAREFEALERFGGVRGEGKGRGVYTTPDAPPGWRATCIRT